MQLLYDQVTKLFRLEYTYKTTWVSLQLRRGLIIRRKAITISRKKSKEELYADFLSKFPNMEQEVKRYFLYGDDLKIYTKHGGKFLFHLTNDSFELKAM